MATFTKAHIFSRYSYCVYLLILKSNQFIQRYRIIVVNAIFFASNFPLWIKNIHESKTIPIIVPWCIPLGHYAGAKHQRLLSMNAYGYRHAMPLPLATVMYNRLPHKYIKNRFVWIRVSFDFVWRMLFETRYLVACE